MLLLIWRFRFTIFEGNQLLNYLLKPQNLYPNDELRDIDPIQPKQTCYGCII